MTINLQFFLPKGVACHVGFTLAQWNDGKVDEPLSRATFTSENKPLSVDCEVRMLPVIFFYYYLFIFIYLISCLFSIWQLLIFFLQGKRVVVGHECRVLFIFSIVFVLFA